MRKRQVLKTLSLILTLALVFQFLPSGVELRADEGDLKLPDAQVVIHGTNHDPADRSTTITVEHGGTEIPLKDGAYNNVPAGATIKLKLYFSLEDGIGGAEEEPFGYQEGHYFYYPLPGGINFDFVDPLGEIQATDTESGEYHLADASFDANGLRITLTEEGAEEEHRERWAYLEIEGTFDALQAGDETEQTWRLGETTITINREPLPTESTLAKSGVYDATANEITWTVGITPPVVVGVYDYSSYIVIDEFGPNQTYVAGSYEHGNDPILDADLTIDTDNRKITYQFPEETTGPQTISFKTQPTTFAQEGSVQVGNVMSTYAQFDNKVNLTNAGGDKAAEEATADVKTDWIKKSGEKVSEALMKWTVIVEVPGKADGAISGAKIIDTLGANHTLKSGSVTIQKDSADPIPVEEGEEAGKYQLSEGILTYQFGEPLVVGTTYKLKYETIPTEPNTDLDTNDSVSFENKATLTWGEEITATKGPSDSAKVEGVGAYGLINKSGAPAYTGNYIYSETDPGTIKWTITVNRNKITMNEASVEDLIPTGQALYADADKPFQVHKEGQAAAISSYTDIATTDAARTAVGAQGFTYVFSDPITETHTITYYTRLVPSETNGLDKMYSNGDTNGNAGFKNKATLKRKDKSVVDREPTANLKPRMLTKSVILQYDYNARTVKWQLVINRNKLPMTDAYLTDELPPGMDLLIDNDHVFNISDGTTNSDLSLNTAVSEGDLLGSKIELATVNGEAGFELTLPSSTSKQYTVTFYTELNEAYLKEQFNERTLNNKASLYPKGANGPKIDHSASVKIKNPIITKTHNYDNTVTPKEDTVHWAGYVNLGQLRLQNGVVVDQLPEQSLQLVPGTVKLYEVSINNDGTPDDPDSLVEVDLGPVADESHFALTYDISVEGGKKEFRVHLPTYSSSAYKLTFDTLILKDDISLTNTISLHDEDKIATSSGTEIVVSKLYSGGGSGSYKLIVKKIDASNNNAPMNGVALQLLNAGKGALTGKVATTSTVEDQDGIAVFSSLPNWVFYVEEIDPPAGYLKAEIVGGKRPSEFGVGEVLLIENRLALAKVVNVRKVDTSIQPLSGVEFRLTGEKYDGTDLLDSEGNELIAFSGTDGVVSFGNVPLSKNYYVLEEVAPPHGFLGGQTKIYVKVAYTPDKTAVTVTYSDQHDGTYSQSEPIFINTLGVTTVGVIKVDESGELYLEDAEFELRRRDGTGEPKTAKTNSEGVVQFAGVGIGEYVVEEVTPREGYLLGEIVKYFVNVGYADDGEDGTDYTKVEATYSVTGEAGSFQTGFPTMVNTLIEETVGVIKRDDAAPQSRLEGARFVLLGHDYHYVAGPEATDEHGVVEFKDIPFGRYYLVETHPAEGYLRDADLLVHVDVGYALAGSESPNYAKAEVRYSLDGVDWSTEDDFPFINNRMGLADISIYKLSWASNPENYKPLSGGKFGLYKEDGTLVNGDGKASNDPKGKIVFKDVPIGEYYIQEITPPTGYQKNTAKIPVEVRYTNDGTGAEFNSYEGPVLMGDNPDNYRTAVEVVFGIYTDPMITEYEVLVEGEEPGYLEQLSFPALLNKLVPYVPNAATAKVKKVDTEGKALAGAAFTLYNADGAEVAVAVSNEEGIAEFVNLTPYTGYSIKETGAPNGYIASEEVIKFTSGDGAVHEFTVVNEKEAPQYGRISIKKLGENSTPLAGATFGLYDEDGGLLATATTDANGNTAFENVPLGFYFIKEIAAPKGYILNSEQIEAHLEEEQTYEFMITNQPEEPDKPIEPVEELGRITLVKRDLAGGPLAGAEFSVYNTAGQVVGKAVTGTDGVLKFENLPLGTYTVRETGAPQGYQLFAEALTVTLDSAAPNKSFALKNAKDDEPREEEGWEEFEDEDTPGGGTTVPKEELPKTGGIPNSLLLLTLGLVLLAGGLLLRRKHSRA